MGSVLVSRKYTCSIRQNLTEKHQLAFLAYTEVNFSAVDAFSESDRGDNVVLLNFQSAYKQAQNT